MVAKTVSTGNGATVQSAPPPAPPSGDGTPGSEDETEGAVAPDPKRPKYGRRQAPANVEKLPPKLSCGTASGRGFFVANPDPDMRPV